MITVHKKRVEDVGWWSLDIRSNQFSWCEIAQKIYNTKGQDNHTIDQFLNFFTESSKELFKESIEELFQKKKPFVMEGSIIDSNQKQIWIRISGAVAQLERDSVSKICGTIRIFENEINDHCKSQLLYSILDEIAIISITDVQGRILYANKMFSDVSGYEFGELIGKNHRIIKSDQHSKEFYREMWQTILAKKAWKGEIINRKRNGDLYYVDAHIYPVLNFKNEITEFISVRFDTTERTLENQKELVRAKFQMMGETSAQIMHDVMNPLAIIQMNLESLHRQLDAGNCIPQEALYKKIVTMKESSGRIKSIFSNMKDLLHNKVDTEEVDIYECVKKAVEISNLKLTKHRISIKIDLEPGQYYVLMNFQQLLQVIINLINNSADAIELKDEKWIHFKVAQNRECSILSVIDSGSGIKKDLHNKIFESLFTTKDINRGTGLGLSICKRIVESSKGKIEINAESPHTQFDIHLPSCEKLVKAS